MQKILNNNKKTIVFAIVGAIVLVGLALGIYFGVRAVVNQSNKKYAEDPVNRDLLEMGVPQKEINKLTDEEKDELIQNEYYDRVVAKDYVFSEKNKEYDGTTALTTELYSLIGSYSFSKIIDRVEPLLKQYNFTTEENRRIVQIYEDATTLTKIYKFSESTYGNVLDNCISPIVFSAVYLGAPTSIVSDYTLADEAMYPLYNGIITIEGVELLTGDTITKDSMGSVLSKYVDASNSTLYKTSFNGSTYFGKAPVSCYVEKTGEMLNMIGCFDLKAQSIMLNVRQLTD